jgi:hypothetical protein
MQISGASLTLTWPCRPCLLRVLLGATATATSLAFFKHTGGGGATHAFSSQHVYLQFTCEMSLPRAPVEFSSHYRFYKLSCSCLLGVCRCSCLLQPACLFTVPGRISPPAFGTQGTPPCLLCVFFTIVYYSVWFFFSFFPGWGWVCPGGYADLAQGCLWEYCVLLSSPGGLHLPKWSGRWGLAAWEPSWFLCLT